MSPRLVMQGTYHFGVFQDKNKTAILKTISRMVLPIHSAGSQQILSMGIISFFTWSTKDSILDYLWKKKLDSMSTQLTEKGGNYKVGKYTASFQEATV